ncbi:hypothetical protein SSBR45G_17840 [Bradyrhizobium sp. SSBR45G]|nr:hypothetical protein SSBR45G_17840 [Bradyrhizobium sp. SSBR45G]GLH83634.1 hypothetical protein SSBR45R_10940 [Bradyrhizobium sp. SSBR45R]
MSNALSQLAVPFTSTTFLASSLISSPKASAAWAGAAAGGVAGAWAAAGDDDGEGLALAAGVGLVEGAGLADAAGDADAVGAGIALGTGAGEAEAAGAGEACGACARATVPPSASATELTARTRRKVLRFIRLFSSGRAAWPGTCRRMAGTNMPGGAASHDRCVMPPCGLVKATPVAI